MFFGLQETRDSLKRAFENLFDKYGQEFDDDDEIDILSLKVVKKSNKKNSEIQKPRKFGFLYHKEGEQISEEETDKENDYEEEDEEEEENSEDGAATPSNLEKIINERSNILVSASSSKLDKVLSKPIREKKSRKVQKRMTQLQFDLTVLRLFELEMSAKLKKSIKICPEHEEDVNRNCFECSLINIIP